MRPLAAVGAALIVIALAPGAVAQDSLAETCRGASDLSEHINCLARIETLRPYNDAGGRSCASLETETFTRPVAGRRVIGFGDKTQYGSSSKGVVIETTPAAQVVAPSDGLVLYAGDFRSYGLLVILEAGCGVSFLLAGVAEADVKHGQLVLAGQPVGIMSRASSRPDMFPVLYVEMRRDQRPVDPGSDIAGQ